MSTRYPLIATAPNVPEEIRQKTGSWQMWKVTKSMNVQVPRYGTRSAQKFMCFDYMTEGNNCKGYFIQSGRKKTCHCLHVNLDPNDSFQSNRSSHFVDLVCFLETPGIEEHFVPTDAFATSQQLRDAESSL
jgi:hypothetical protein